MIRLTKEEREANSIAKQLVKALTRIENFSGDPELILDSAKVTAINSRVGIQEALRAIREYYCGEGNR